MLRAIIICPDVELNERLDTILNDIGIVAITRVMDHYPNTQELLRFLRAHAPQLVFISAEAMAKAGETVVEDREEHARHSGDRRRQSCDPQLLMELMPWYSRIRHVSVR